MDAPTFALKNPLQIVAVFLGSFGLLLGTLTSYMLLRMTAEDGIKRDPLPITLTVLEMGITMLTIDCARWACHYLGNKFLPGLRALNRELTDKVMMASVKQLAFWYMNGIWLVQALAPYLVKPYGWDVASTEHAATVNHIICAYVLVLYADGAANDIKIESFVHHVSAIGYICIVLAREEMAGNAVWFLGFVLAQICSHTFAGVNKFNTNVTTLHMMRQATLYTFLFGKVMQFVGLIFYCYIAINEKEYWYLLATIVMGTSWNWSSVVIVRWLLAYDPERAVVKNIERMDAALDSRLKANPVISLNRYESVLMGIKPEDFRKVQTTRSSVRPRMSLALVVQARLTADSKTFNANSKSTDTKKKSFLGLPAVSALSPTSPTSPPTTSPPTRRSYFTARAPSFPDQTSNDIETTDGDLEQGGAGMDVKSSRL